jgi:hypothetical protein
MVCEQADNRQSSAAIVGTSADDCQPTKQMSCPVIAYLIFSSVPRTIWLR